MAQREKEETEFKVLEGFKLCINNCGFPGNPATNNMCQKCYKATGILTHPFPAISFPENQEHVSIRSPERSDDGSSSVAVGAAFDSDESCRKQTEQSQVQQVNRCWCCRKRVGLTGFRCRCGDLFCGKHRYSDEHDCSFDYRSAGKETIARENPLVKASKIIRI